MRISLSARGLRRRTTKARLLFERFVPRFRSCYSHLVDCFSRAFISFGARVPSSRARGEPDTSSENPEIPFVLAQLRFDRCTTRDHRSSRFPSSHPRPKHHTRHWVAFAEGNLKPQAVILAIVSENWISTDTRLIA